MGTVRLVQCEKKDLKRESTASNYHSEPVCLAFRACMVPPLVANMDNKSSMFGHRWREGYMEIESSELKLGKYFDLEEIEMNFCDIQCRLICVTQRRGSRTK